LETLLDWHSKFPVTQYERDRNEMIAEQLQFNRNPFIDNQQWAASIWK
jgi:endonuclease I